MSKRGKSLLYRIFTENVDIDRIETIAKVSFDGYSIYETRGYWMGDSENSVCVEVLYANPTFQEKNRAQQQVETFIRVIKDLNRQKSVLYQKLWVTAQFANPIRGYVVETL